MAMYGYACRAVYGYIGLCMGIVYGYVGLCMAM